MLGCDINDVDACLEMASKVVEQDVFLEDSKAPYAEVIFLKMFAQCQQRFGLPFYPGQRGSDKLPKGLVKIFRLLAIWDFELFQLSIRMENIEGRKMVFLRHHVKS